MPFFLRNLFDMVNYPATIIDDFYESPMKIRQYALEQSYFFCHEKPDIKYVFPGMRTADLSDLNSSLYQNVCKKIMSIFHIPEYDELRFQLLTNFQIVQEKYQSGIIHVDGDTIFSGILFLTPDAPLNSGTSLYKPNAKFNQTAFQNALDLNDSLFKENLPVNFEHHDMFDETLRVNNLFNRLVIFEGHIPHSANNFFGTTKHNSRLTQVFFLKRLDAKKEYSIPLRRVRNIKM